MKRYLVSILVLALLGGAGWWAWDFFGPQPPAEAPPQEGGFAMPVAGQEVKVDTVLRTVEAVGTLSAHEAITVRPEIDGLVTAIEFDEGQRVLVGKVLVKLDDTILQAELVQAKASLALSERNYQRAAALAGQGSGTQRARDEALAALQYDQAAVQLVEAKIKKTVIVAPFDGFVGLRSVSLGDYVSPGQDLVNLSDITPIKVDFRVPELYLPSIQLGQELQVRVDAFPDTSFAGTVVAIDPQVDVNGRALVIRAEIPNGSLLLRPGLFARVDVVLERHDNAVLVPEAAIVPTKQGASVFKVVDGFAKQTPVVLGLRRPGEVEILEGLAAGDVVVTEGQIKLQDGMPVQLLPPPGEAPAPAPSP